MTSNRIMPKLLLVTFIYLGLILLSFSSCSKAQQPVEHKVAIVGAGIGGTASAYYLHQLFADTYRENNTFLNVTIFERGFVGGRIVKVDIAGHTYEPGPYIIHPRNKLVNDLIYNLGLRWLPEFSFVSGWERQRFTILGENEVIFQQWGSLTSLQFYGRYGIRDLYKMNSHVSHILSNFECIYPELESGNYFHNVSDFLQKMNTRESLSMFEYTNISLTEALKKENITDLLINELAGIAVRIWARQPHEIHAVAGGAALAGVDSNLIQVKGGAKRLAEELLTRSRANLVQAQVNSISRLQGSVQDRRMFDVAFQRVNQPSDIVFTEGGNNGRPQSAPVTSYEEHDTFDAVIIATPLEANKNVIKLYGLGDDISYPQTFIRDVRTIVSGKIIPKGIGYPEGEEMTGATYYLDDGPMNSVNIMLPVCITFGADTEALPEVWELNSKRPFDTYELDNMFEYRNETKVFDFLLYPQYNAHGLGDLGPFKLSRGLYYINAAEWAVSCLEMSAAVGLNCANAIYDEFKVGSSDDQKSHDYNKEEL